MNKLLSTSDYLTLPSIFYRESFPTAVVKPKYFIFNKDLAKQLNLNTEYLLSDSGLNLLSGEHMTDLSPISQSYMGHQFGHLTMLGDGRAILLGELANGYDLQLKGSGPTAFSRNGDGMATLGPMLREYIISEAMHELNIPTTRSLAVIETGREVRRQNMERGALLVRIASSHLRVGTFEFASYYGKQDDLRALADYAINKHYPHLAQAKSPYFSLLKTVIKKQAELVAKWQLVGFVHGVMNTDNMTISGETIDYGPCAFLDHYKSNQVFSSIDVNGRYAYNEQPNIAGWNLTRFAETLLPLIDEDKDKAISLAQKELSKYGNLFDHYWQKGLLKKIGLHEHTTENIQLVSELLNIMEIEKRDFTETFRALTLLDTQILKLDDSFALTHWYEKWSKLIAPQKQMAINDMKQINPAFIPRNYLVEEAIAEAELTGDKNKLNALLSLIKNPYEYNEKQLAYVFPDDKRDDSYKTYCGT